LRRRQRAERFAAVVISTRVKISTALARRIGAAARVSLNLFAAQARPSPV